MSEWLKEHAWKACVGETLPWVRIPLSPPTSLRWRREPVPGFARLASLIATPHESDSLREMKTSTAVAIVTGPKSAAGLPDCTRPGGSKRLATKPVTSHAARGDDDCVPSEAGRHIPSTPSSSNRRRDRADHRRIRSRPATRSSFRRRSCGRQIPTAAARARGSGTTGSWGLQRRGPAARIPSHNPCRRIHIAACVPQYSRPGFQILARHFCQFPTPIFQETRALWHRIGHDQA